jgi:hypothetical protein
MYIPPVLLAGSMQRMAHTGPQHHFRLFAISGVSVHTGPLSLLCVAFQHCLFLMKRLFYFLLLLLLSAQLAAAQCEITFFTTEQTLCADAASQEAVFGFSTSVIPKVEYRISGESSWQTAAVTTTGTLQYAFILPVRADRVGLLTQYDVRISDQNINNSGCGPQEFAQNYTINYGAEGLYDIAFLGAVRRLCTDAASQVANFNFVTYEHLSKVEYRISGESSWQTATFTANGATINRAHQYEFILPVRADRVGLVTQYDARISLNNCSAEEFPQQFTVDYGNLKVQEPGAATTCSDAATFTLIDLGGFGPNQTQVAQETTPGSGTYGAYQPLTVSETSATFSLAAGQPYQVIRYRIRGFNPGGDPVFPDLFPPCTGGVLELSVTKSD